jgi:nitrate reductase delta subunit
MAAPDRFLLHELAELVDYPGPSHRHVLEECRRLSTRLPERARADLLAFLDWARGRPVEELEELYAATFDSSDACALELGWHLYGETYARGVFLVEMRARLRACGIEEGSELPDHLSHVLRWLARSGAEGDEEARRVVRLAVAPAVAAVVRGLEPKSSPWLPLLRCLLALLDPEGKAVVAAAPRAEHHSFEGGCA